MKKVFAVVIIMILIPINYIGAEDKKTIDPVNFATSMPSEGYLPLPAKHTYNFFKEGMTKESKNSDFLDCIEGQRRIISYGRMSDGIEKTKPHRGYNSTVWVVIQCMEKKGYVGKKHNSNKTP